MQYRNCEEQTVFFDLPHAKGFKIKGIMRGKLGGPIAVMVHGRPGSGNELLQYLGARFLHGQGITTLRLFMYDFGTRARSLMDCTLQTHVADFEAVVAALRKQNTGQLFAVGHSYGGLTILQSTAHLDGAVLWDPSHGLWWAENRDALYAKEFPEKIVGDYVIGTAGSGWVYPTAAAEYDKQLGDTSHLAIKEYPLKIISAGNGALTDLGARYYNAARQPKSHAVIANATHGFDDSDDVMAELFKETSTWLNNFAAS